MSSMVICSPLAMPGMCCSRVSSSDSLPSSTSCRTALPVNVLVIDAMRTWLSATKGAPVSRLSTPDVTSQVWSPIVTRAVAPAMPVFS
jgi:hypothetical protein